MVDSPKLAPVVERIDPSWEAPEGWDIDLVGTGTPLEGSLLSAMAGTTLLMFAVIFLPLVSEVDPFMVLGVGFVVGLLVVLIAFLVSLTVSVDTVFDTWDPEHPEIVYTIGLYDPRLVQRLRGIKSPTRTVTRTVYPPGHPAIEPL